MDNLVIVGATTWASEITDFVERYHLFDVVGYCVDKKYMSPEFKGRPVYPLEIIEDYVDKDTVKLFISISWHQKLSDVRRNKYIELKEKGYHFANLISPLAIVKCSSIGEGNWIQDAALVGYGTKIGNGNFILSQTMLGHYTSLGDDNALAGRACIGGDCVIGNQNYFGLNATVFNGVHIGNKNIIGGGTVLKDSIMDFTIVSAPEPTIKQTKEKVVELAVSADFIHGAR